MPRSLTKYPKRGEVFIADLNPAFGREIHKKRPVLVISNNTLNQILPTVIMAPFSSIVPEFIGPDVIKIKDSRIGLAKDSAIIINQMRSIDKSRLVKKVGILSKGKFEEVEDALKIVLGLDSLD